MKHLSKSRIETAIAIALVLSACSKSSDSDSDTGGATGQSGGQTGTTTGGRANTGGSNTQSQAGAATGGAPSVAGASSSVGGSPSAAGGSPSAAGGSPGAAGGSPGAAGGSVGGGGRSGGAGSGGGSSTGASGSAGSAAGGAGSTNPTACSGAVHSPKTTTAALPSVALTVPSGFVLETIAKVSTARELAALPNDLLVGTSGTSIYLVPNADSTDAPGAPVVFTTINDTPVQGVAFSGATCTVYASSQKGIYSMKYADGQQSAAAGTAIANVRTGTISPNRPSGDTDNHTSSSVTVAGGKVYAGVGSSCNACVESDGTRASIQQMDADGKNMSTRATRFRNAIALTANPVTGTLWAGGAGQDNLSATHPFEFFDAVGLHSGVADYGWPDCEENHIAYKTGADCSGTVAPLIELPAYSTIIGAAFYPTTAGAKAFPATYQGGLFLTAHGSWHKTGNAFAAAPLVVFVPMNGDAPKTAVDWSDATKQWTEFVGGFQKSDGTTRIARPTGVAVGALGSLFVADDQNGYVFRIRPM